MTSSAKATLIGFGDATAALSLDDMREIVEERLEDVTAGSRVLAIIPDKTRDDNTHLLFPLAAKSLLSRRIAAPDVLVAQGTHAPMADLDKLIKVGIEVPSSDRLTIL